MNWSIIYSVDVRSDQDGENFIPTSEEWIVTEEDDEYDETYYEGLPGHHRKLAAFISDEDFRDFLDDILYPVFVENTMGMLGGMTPEGMGLGLMPAWSLSTELYSWNDPLYQNAYVCPFAENDEEYDFLVNLEDIRKWIEEEYL